MIVALISVPCVPWVDHITNLNERRVLLEKNITNLNISGKRVVHPGKPNPRPIPTPPLLVVEPSLPPSAW